MNYYYKIILTAIITSWQEQGTEGGSVAEGRSNLKYIK